MTAQDILDFEKEYNQGKYPHQRLGQAFCNKFNITDPDIFYEENDKVAKLKIWQYFFLS